MFAACFDTVGKVALFSTRVTLFVIGLWAMWLTGTQLVRKLRGGGLNVVPTVTWVFCFAWSFVLTAVAATILVTCESISSRLVLAFYGASLAWLIGGLLSIVAVGVKEMNRVAVEARRLQTELAPLVKQDQRQRDEAR